MGRLLTPIDCRTPGTSMPSAYGLRPSNGSSATCLVPTTWPTVELSLSSNTACADVDGFGDCAHFQHQIEPGDLLHIELQLGLANRLESGLRHGQVVDARQQRWKIVVALVVGLDTGGNTASLGDGGHAGLRDNFAGWVGDTAGNGCRLGTERG